LKRFSIEVEARMGFSKKIHLGNPTAGSTVLFRLSGLMRNDAPDPDIAM
jgi:hypothetical protein